MITCNYILAPVARAVRRDAASPSATPSKVCGTAVVPGNGAVPRRSLLPTQPIDA